MSQQPGPNDQTVVVIDTSLPREPADRLRRLSPKIELIDGLSKDALRRAHVIYTFGADFDPADAPNLQWVQVGNASVTHIRDTPIANSQIPIANVSGAFSPAVAEFTIALLLTLTRRLPMAHSLQLQTTWLEDDTPLAGENCFGKTMGIVGYGSIGRHIARIAQAMGLKVLACKRRPELKRDTSFCFPNLGDPDGTIPEAWFGTPQMVEMLKMSDVAVVTLPQTPATENLIGKQELEALPAHAYLISIGRGAVVNESALIEHLQAGRLAGAALDVFATEPLPAGSPLWKLPNVIVTPHLGSWTINQSQMAAEVLVENMSRYLKGQPLVSRVDMKWGY